MRGDRCAVFEGTSGGRTDVCSVLGRDRISNRETAACDARGRLARPGRALVSISGGGTLDGAVPRGLYYCEGRHIADSQTNDGEEGDDPRLTSTVTEAGTHYVSARCAAAENSAKRLPQRCVLVLPDRSLGQWNSVRHSVSGDASMTMWCADTETDGCRAPSPRGQRVWPHAGCPRRCGGRPLRFSPTEVCSVNGNETDGRFMIALDNDSYRAQ